MLHVERGYLRLGRFEPFARKGEVVLSVGRRSWTLTWWPLPFWRE
jgi:hypothetical protein